MNYEEFKTLFKENHKVIVNTIMRFLEIDDIDVLNHMIERSYVAFAGGYARRLYMVQNDIEMTPEDMNAYFSSDVDFFSISSHFEEKVTPVLDNFFNITSSSSISLCYVDEIDKFKLNIYCSKDKENTICLNFKPLKNKLKSLPLPKYQRQYAFYKGSQVMVSEFGKNHIFSIQNVENTGKPIPHVQYVNISKKKLVETTKTVKVDHKIAYTCKLVSTFDLSQTKFFIEYMSDDMDKCIVNSQYANTNNIYQCDVSECAMNNVNQISRILKYAEIGMMFKEEDIKNLLEGQTMNGNNGIVEGGYY